MITLVDIARIRSTTRAIHHIAWWVFVVATLFAGGVTWLGGRHESGLISPGDLVSDGSYQTFQRPTTSLAYETSLSISFTPDTPQVVSFIAFTVVMIATVIEAIVLRHIVMTTAAIAIPLAAVGMFAMATPNGRWSVDVGTTAAMVLVLIGIAIHQTWMFYTGRRRDTGEENSG